MPAGRFSVHRVVPSEVNIHADICSLNMGAISSLVSPPSVIAPHHYDRSDLFTQGKHARSYIAMGVGWGQGSSTGRWISAGLGSQTGQIPPHQGNKSCGNALGKPHSAFLFLSGGYSGPKILISDRSQKQRIPNKK